MLWYDDYTEADEVADAATGRLPALYAANVGAAERQGRSAPMQKHVILATVELVVEGEPGQDAAMARARDLVGQELQLDRKNAGVAIRAMRGESVLEVLSE